jgi:hypothetical protein
MQLTYPPLLPLNKLIPQRDASADPKTMEQQPALKFSVYPIFPVQQLQLACKLAHENEDRNRSVTRSLLSSVSKIERISHTRSHPSPLSQDR